MDKTREDISQDETAAGLARRVNQLESQLRIHDAELKGLAPLQPLIERVSQILRHFGGG